MGKKPKLSNKPEHEGSESTDNNHSHHEKETEHTKYKGSQSTFKDVDSLADFFSQTLNAYEFPEEGYSIHIT